MGNWGNWRVRIRCLFMLLPHLTSGHGQSPTAGMRLGTLTLFRATGRGSVSHASPGDVTALHLPFLLAEFSTFPTPASARALDFHLLLPPPPVHPEQVSVLLRALCWLPALSGWRLPP